MENSIEKSIALKAPVATVWHAISDPAAVSQWFGARFEAPFIVGQPAQGVVTYPGYEGIIFEIAVLERHAPERFAFSWTPNAIDMDRDYSGETPTTVTLAIRPAGDGTELTVTEHGFATLPIDRAEDAYRANDEGWTMILDKISQHVGG